MCLGWRHFAAVFLRAPPVSQTAQPASVLVEWTVRVSSDITAVTMDSIRSEVQRMLQDLHTTLVYDGVLCCTFMACAGLQR